MTSHTPPKTRPRPATDKPEQRFWINTVSLDHVEAATKGGFTQADHGARTRLGRPRPGDEMIFYSPRTSLQNGTPVRQFTAWATITGDEPYRVDITENFRPWRLAATFTPAHPWTHDRLSIDCRSFQTLPTGVFPFVADCSPFPEKTFR